MQHNATQLTNPASNTTRRTEMKIFPQAENWAERPIWLFIYSVVLAVCSIATFLDRGLL